MQVVSSLTERTNLYEKFKSRIIHNSYLDRTLVSYQGNKHASFSSWFKYREGFSERLVTYLLQTFKPEPGILIDPFSGVGSSLFAASALGWQTTGIELLPVGIFATQARIIAQKINVDSLQFVISKIKKINFQDYYDELFEFNHLTITRGAFSSINEKQLVGYISYCHNNIPNKDISTLLIYTAFCILEDISYTRKDGQYLRWDTRLGRSKGNNEFNKGEILSFEDAINRKLNQITSDLGLSYVQLDLFTDNLLLELAAKKSNDFKKLQPDFYEGSCLKILPTLQDNSIDFVLTSPPYVNRYDYTRTYALELAFLGCSEDKVKSLRQKMLSCTVENRDKRNYLEEYYTGQ